MHQIEKCVAKPTIREMSSSHRGLDSRRLPETDGHTHTKRWPLPAEVPWGSAAAANRALFRRRILLAARPIFRGGKLLILGMFVLALAQPERASGIAVTRPGERWNFLARLPSRRSRAPIGSRRCGWLRPLEPLRT